MSSTSVHATATMRYWMKKTTNATFAHFTSSDVLDFFEFCELLHCHQDVLDEADDGCHFWYCQEGIGASRSSPDSRWRRCNFVNASLKFERSFIGAFLRDLFSVIYQFTDISHIPHRIGSRSGLPVQICPSRCTSPRSSQF